MTTHFKVHRQISRTKYIDGAELADAKERATISIVVPVFNEEETLVAVVEELLEFTARQAVHRYEIIVVDDGSLDGTPELLDKYRNHVTVITHPYRRGYGASLVSGALRSTAATLAFYDADGQHSTSYLDLLLAHREKYDMVVGARLGGTDILHRRLGVSLLSAFAGYLVGFHIPDLTSGYRAVDREAFLQHCHLYPSGFSISSTMTLAFVRSGRTVKFVRVPSRARQGGSSMVRCMRDGVAVLGTIASLTMLFAPKKVFMPVSALLLLLGIGSFAYELLWRMDIGDNTVILLLSALGTTLFGLLADQVAAIRRELRLF